MDVRSQILREATRLMAARGFEGMSLQAVADAVGVKKPSVLYHFPSKAELRRAVLDELLSRWNDVLPRLLMASALTGLAKFDAVMNELMSFFVADPDRARLVVRELLDRPGEMMSSLGAQVQPWVKVVSSYVAMGQNAGQIKKDVDPEVYVLHVACLALSSVATTHAFDVAMPHPGASDAGERAMRELIRMARTSLFEESYLLHQSEKSASAIGAM